MASEHSVVLPPLQQQSKHPSDIHSLSPTKKKTRNPFEISASNPYSVSNSIDGDEYQVNLGPGSYNIPSTLCRKLIGMPYKNTPSYVLSKTKRNCTPLISDSPGVFYNPNYRFIKRSSPGYKMGNSKRELITSRTASLSPGPKYNLVTEKDISKCRIGPKIHPESPNKGINNSMCSAIYKLEGLFEENVRKKKGTIMGKSKKGLQTALAESPGPGRYECQRSNSDAHSISFTKVFSIIRQLNL